MLGLRFCARVFSSCGKHGPLFMAVRGPLTIAASLVAEHRLHTRRLSNCGSRAQLLRGMWDLPRPGLEPASPALASRLSTTAPPGKPQNVNLNKVKIQPMKLEKLCFEENNFLIFHNRESTDCQKMKPGVKKNKQRNDSNPLTSLPSHPHPQPSTLEGALGNSYFLWKRSIYLTFSNSFTSFKFSSFRFK